MILNLKILKYHKILSKGREQAAELLASVSKIFDIPQPSYSYVEKKDILSSPTQTSFDDLVEKQLKTLSHAFDLHRAQGGTQPESVINYKGKHAEQLENPIIVKPRITREG